jgi:hypothetical protein
MGSVPQVQVKDYPDQPEELTIGWGLSASDFPGTFGETPIGIRKHFFRIFGFLSGIEIPSATLAFGWHRLTRSSIESPNPGFTGRFGTFICRKLHEIRGWQIVLIFVGRHNESMRSAFVIVPHASLSRPISSCQVEIWRH